MCQRMSRNSAAPGSSPQNITVTSVNPASLNVSWQPPLEKDHNGPITGYVIQYIAVVSGNISLNVSNQNMYIIQSLLAYVNYSVMVAAVNFIGAGPLSDPVVGRSGEYSELE